MSTTRSSFNLASPNQIRAACDLSQLHHWFACECQSIQDLVVRQVVCQLGCNLDSFVRFPPRAILLWHGCNRIAPKGEKQKYHNFPPPIKERAKQIQIPLDSRPNGPAIASFLLAGGERPMRFGSTNAWSIHHLYSGKFPYLGRKDSLHAQKHGTHFTQSAGLVAVHPLADALCDEFPAFSWLLRALAFRHAGYDPDGVFTHNQIDDFGFANGKSTQVIFSDANG